MGRSKTLSMSLKSGTFGVKKRRDPLQQRVPQNPKYENVRSTLDTGSSVNKWKASNADAKPKKDEYFKRIRGSQLIELMDEEDIEEESVYNIGVDESEENRTAVHTAEEVDPSEALFLLLDIRSEEDFNTGHIRMAIHYPHTQLHHATNYFTSEIYRYKNRPDRMIVLYGDDDKSAAAAATLFVEKGVDNVFVLTGGLSKFVVKFEEYIQGDVPEFDDVSSCPPSTAQSRNSARSQNSRLSYMPQSTSRSRQSSLKSVR